MGTDVLNERGATLIREADARITTEGEMSKPMLAEVVRRESGAHLMIRFEQAARLWSMNTAQMNRRKVQAIDRSRHLRCFDTCDNTIGPPPPQR